MVVNGNYSRVLRFPAWWPAELLLRCVLPGWRVLTQGGLCLGLLHLRQGRLVLHIADGHGFVWHHDVLLLQ